MKRRQVLEMSGLAGAAVMAGRFIPKAPQAKRPNILFMMSDDHGYQAISCYDGRLNQTPNIDRLARDGVRFTRSFCTNSLCGPSRAVLLTGKYRHRNGVIDNNVGFDGSQVTFPKLLQKSGYRTAVFGKWHLQSSPTGFDYWNILPGQGDYYNPDMIEMRIQKKRQGYVTDLTTDDCLVWLEKRDRDHPFCVLLHHKAPHRNWLPDLRHIRMYEGETKPLPETFYDDYSTRSDAWELYDLKKDPHELHNVYGDSAYAGVAKEMKTELERLRRLYGDTDEKKFLPKEPVKKANQLVDPD